MARIAIDTDRLFLTRGLPSPHALGANRSGVGGSGFGMQEAAIKIDEDVALGLLAHFHFLARITASVCQRRR
jgi:hypothetical protein